MSRIKRLLIAGTLFLIATAAALLTYRMTGSSAIESWVGTQLLEIAGTYLQPELRFQRLTYLRPRTIIVDNLSLNAADPARPGQTVAIFAAKRARLELTEMPRRGKPIKFSEIILDSLEVNAIAAPDGSLVGFSNLLKHGDPPPANAAPTSGTSASASAPAPTAATTAAAAPFKLSDFLLIRRLQISNGIIQYDSRTTDSPPLLLDGINTHLDFTPADDKNPGLYNFATTLDRKPAIDLSLKGTLNIDTFIMTLENISLALDVQEKNAHFLPSELQRLVKTHEVTGQFRAAAKGTLPLLNLTQTSLESASQLTGASVAIGENRFSVESLSSQSRIDAGTLRLIKSEAKLLGGSMLVSGSLPFDGTTPTEVTVKATDLKIEQLLRVTKPDEPPFYAGLFSADLRFAAPLPNWNKQAAGGGTLTIRKGKLENLPILGKILAVVGKSLKVALTLGKEKFSDTADGRLTLASDHIRVDEITGTAGALAFRVTGTVGFDEKLALHLNGGPLETIQNALGPLGKVWADISDALAGYRITGTLSDPKVSVEVLGK